MEEQEAVETPVEQTTQTESAPVETNTEVAQEAPVESIDTEKEVSKSVPYDRFTEVNTKAKTLAEENEYLKTILAQQQAPVQSNEPQTEFDEETAAGVKRLAQQEFVNLKVAEFQTKHGAELAKDKLLRAAVRTEMEEQSARGMIIDPELALETAKQELSKRMQPQVEQAKTEGLKEGQDIAKTKQQLGAVGETGKQPEADDSQLSPAEYAKKYNIPVSF